MGSDGQASKGQVGGPDEISRHREADQIRLAEGSEWKVETRSNGKHVRSSAATSVCPWPVVAGLGPKKRLC